MRAGALGIASLLLAATATKALAHMVMVPAEHPAMWCLAIGSGLLLFGLALMPGEK